MNELPPHHKVSIIRSFPLLILVLAAYNAAMFSGHSFSVPETDALLHLRLISGAEWLMGWREAIVISGLVLLFVEILKSTRPGPATMIEHVLSMLVFIVFLIEFLVVAGAGTSTFLVLGLMSLIDVMGGYAISIAVARKEMNITA